MFTYENGLLLAFFIWVFGVIRVVILSNSRAQKNLKLIGKRMSYNLGVIVDYDYKKEPVYWVVLKFIFLHVLLSLPFVFLSWVYVIYVLGIYSYVFLKDIGAPQSIKEFRWKLRNTDMTFDQIIKEVMKISDQNPEDFEKVRDEIKEEVRLKRNQAI